MVDAIVTMVLEKFTSYAKHKVELVVGVGEEVRKLSFALRMIQEVLQDAEQKQVKNGAVRIWLEELKSILYDADDVMDEWNTKMAISQLHSVNLDDDAHKERKKKVFSLLFSHFSCFKEQVKHVHVRYAIGHQIKKIGEQLDEINVKRRHFGLVNSPTQDQPRLITTSIVDVSTIHGRDQDAEMIVNKLLGESSRQETGVQVISIVGMGGFGKTTLAKLILKDEGVVKNFEKMMWVCVSEPFDFFVVAKTIIEEAHGTVPSSIGWEAIHQSLCSSVKGKKFLLVLDDVWTKDPNHWNPLKISLDGGASGSRIIVTTRNKGVAKLMGSSYIHSVEKLSEGDSWSLLCDIALKGKEDEYIKFEKVGKEIANKCKGVPLALSTLGSLLREKETLQNWRSIAKNDIWGLTHVEDFFLPSLFLSYYALPSVSKQCFLYCSVFPKDTVMSKALLVKLWMAEGFLGSGRMGHHEKAGEECFDNLSMRSFFQDFKKDSHGNIVSCKMHDLVHDFAKYLSLGESSNDANFDSNKVRYLCWKGIEDSSLSEAKRVRTLIGEKPKLSVELFDMLPCRLRILDLGYMKLKKLPDAVGNLIHLRYLNLYWALELLELPETICNLCNLQTLILNDCWNLEKLPEEIGRMSNLRHLEMERTNSLMSLPQSIKRLRSLRTLSKFIVSEECNISDLKHFKNLGGALELKCLGGISNESDAIEADLKKKKDVCCLLFNWEENVDGAAIMGVENIFERLEPHEDLEELKIKNYPGSQFPRWIHNSLLLGNIVKMELTGCDQITQLPALGKLASLESLYIAGMSSVTSIGREFYGFDSSLDAEMIAFPKLKRLELWNMNSVENWELPIISKDTKIMPLLSILGFHGVPKLKALPPCLVKLESLERLDIEDLDIQCLDLGTSNDDEAMPQVLFPNLGELRIGYMNKLEKWSLLLGNGVNTMMSSLHHLQIKGCCKLRVLPDLTIFRSLISLRLLWLDSWRTEEDKEEDSMADCFRVLSIQGCPNLNKVPSYLFSPTLKDLSIVDCPELSGLQCLPPILENLELSKDCGGYSKSIPVAADKECSITEFSLYEHPHSSLPEEFKELKALQKLQFEECRSLDFELKELQHLTMLQHLIIKRCPILEEHFQGDDWRSILAHVPNITINYKEVTNRSS